MTERIMEDSTILNSAMQKSINPTPLQMLLGIRSSIPMIQAVVKDVSKDLAPLRNRDLDQQRLEKRLFVAQNYNTVNKKEGTKSNFQSVILN
ncbi:unnamed protein product [Acanthoscelides obtectus]|uniref:Uncharacterized protein n=1 Tax=Acanthoscelides obtectus TaxID=200917 RepID=A0A9P0QFH7_ACAOB|nr:unnamed protein product [Acanthoscelides obtectus]CAK1632392.1 hypothetical protein AOBTE_LOCUS7531 [Acanthoscelides obtectus]